jgi:hypothetical protein
VPNLSTNTPKLHRHPVRWLNGRSKSRELAEPTDAELAEGVWPRATRDTKDIGTGTFVGGVVLLVGTGIGVHLAGKDHAPGKPPTVLVEVGFPVAGFIVAVIFLLLVRLLLTFRLQRNEARSVFAKLRTDEHSPSPLAPHIGEYHAHGPTLLLGTGPEALPLTPETLDQLSRLGPRLPAATRPEDPQESQASGLAVDDRTDDDGVVQS